MHSLTKLAAWAVCVKRAAPTFEGSLCLQQLLNFEPHISDFHSGKTPLTVERTLKAQIRATTKIHTDFALTYPQATRTTTILQSVLSAVELDIVPRVCLQVISN